jgi:putative oxidoreductase
MSEIALSRPRALSFGDTVSGATRYLVPLGRALFAAIFVFGGLGLFSAKTIGYAASAGVPLANLAVPLAGVIALAGGLSVLLGFHARIGAALIVLFLVPVTLAMHQFWTLTDPMAAQMEMASFMKNVALIGGALVLAHFGAGPISLDARRARRG